MTLNCETLSGKKMLISNVSTEFLLEPNNHLGAACCCPENGRGGKLQTMYLEQAGRIMATGLQIQPDLQAISVYTCSHIIAHRTPSVRFFALF